MKPLRPFAVAMVLCFAFVLSGYSCGPFFDEAIFVQESQPDLAYASYAAGKLGVPRPGYRIQDLVVAYNWLNGSPLTTGEQQQAVHLDTLRNQEHAGTEETLPGMKAWLAARRASGVPGVPPPPTPGTSDSSAIDTYRALPGEDYESYVNCLDDAFATAAQTWTARSSAHAADKAALADWITAQDAVFRNCGNDNATPAAAPAGAPLWLRRDRAYQSAAAFFYQGDFDQAIAGMRSIAQDQSSPWHDIAHLVVARAQIRRAMIGQITDLAADARVPHAPYSAQRDQEQKAFATTVKAKRTSRLTEARDTLRAIVDDAKLNALHDDASKLLDLVQLHLAPEEQAKVLVARLTAPERPQTPGVFEQAMIDLRFYLYPNAQPDDADASKERTLPALGLIDWIRVMQSNMGDSFDSSAATPKLERSAASTQAIAEWKKTQSAAWLIAALTATNSGSGAADLTHAAAAVPRTSPAWTAATYHRLRLAPSTAQSMAETRAELDRVMPLLSQEGSRSVTNLFLMLHQASSPTLDDFLKDAGALPASIGDGDEDIHPPDTKPVDSALCGAGKSQATTLLFDSDTAAILNTRMPLSLLADAAASPLLPRNLSFQIAQATWTRAVLLEQPAIAARMTPLLTGCYPAWKPWLAAYDGAATPTDRQAAGLLALMRFASTVPIVSTGMQRTDGFATYSQFRDNWWTASSDDKPGTPGMVTQATLFGAPMPPMTELADPPFLSATDRTAAQKDVAALRKIPCASDYFATAALEWQKQHPDDPRTPDILGFAERVVRNGCSTDATKELNHRLFVIVQTRYPKSEWAKKYTNWQ